MNYNHPKPYSPPPSLPRFASPRDGGAEDEVDPFDVAATAPRPALDANRARTIVRRAVKAQVVADATSEVQVEDILLEVYAEEPPPPMTRRSSSGTSQSKIAAAIAATVAPAPSQNAAAAVDALLRASDPAFLPFGGMLQQPPRRPTPPAAFTVSGYGYAEQDPPSVAPVAFPSLHLQVAAPSVPPPAYVASGANAQRSGRATTLALWTAGLLLLGAAGGVGIAAAVRNGAYAHLRDSAKVLAGRGSKPAAPAPDAQPIAAAQQPAARVVAPAPPPAAVTATVPSVSVDSLPQPTIPPTQSLVTFPASAHGHRVYFDGKPMSVTTEPVLLRCGRHYIRVGKFGKPRVTDLACGAEVTLVR